MTEATDHAVSDEVHFPAWESLLDELAKDFRALLDAWSNEVGLSG